MVRNAKFKQFILSYPVIYLFFQRLMGSHRFRTRFVKNYIRPHSAMTILDIGCGPADILSYLPNVDYWGFDISEKYIGGAIRRFGQRGKFYCHELMHSDIEKMPSFNIVLALGLLHHLNDDEALNIINLSSKLLKLGGRLLTVDACLETRQNAIAHFLVRNDRGQNVRTKEKYAKLVGTVFDNPRIEIRNQTWIPYTHCIMECTRN